VNFYRTRRRYSSEDGHLHARRRRNLKSYSFLPLSVGAVSDFGPVRPCHSSRKFRCLNSIWALICYKLCLNYWLSMFFVTITGNCLGQKPQRPVSVPSCKCDVQCSLIKAIPVTNWRSVVWECLERRAFMFWLHNTNTQRCPNRRRLSDPFKFHLSTRNRKLESTGASQPNRNGRS
jgi:hypothetical protein